MSLVSPFQGEDLGLLPFCLAVGTVSTDMRCQATVTLGVQLLICRSETTVQVSYLKFLKMIRFS